MLYIIADKSTSPWVLNLDGYPDMERALRAERWMRVGHGEHDEYHICSRIGPNEFRLGGTDETVKATRAPYTEARWDQFIAEWQA